MSRIQMTSIFNNLKNILTVTTLAAFGVIFLSGCLQKNVTTKIFFTPMYNSTALNCQTGFLPIYNKSSEALNLQSWKYKQLQFFIHNIEIKTRDNTWQPWVMETNSYQSNNVALLGEICGEINKQSNWNLELNSLTKYQDITDIRFTLGIPFSLNHLNPLTQASPLNISSMFWGWRGGHKFMRVELATKNDDWLFHLGSTGCKALSPVRAPKEECLQPNRAVISLPFTQGTTHIALDLSVLLNNVELTRENSCQSSPDKQSCKVLFENLGLNTLENNEQLLFKAKADE
jgi:uncharacterized repeat protein (TIGR04052 family)